MRRFFQISVFFSLVLLAAIQTSCREKEAPFQRIGAMEPHAYWVWHRSSELAESEIQNLKSANVRSLYWQAAECRWNQEEWKVSAIARRVPATADLAVVPVFRIYPDARFLTHRDSAAAFLKSVRPWITPTVREIQIDFDCPDRLLASYATFLKKLRADLPSVSISVTALADWPGRSGFTALAEQVSLFAPMFYDMDVDSAEAVMKSQFIPMTGVETETRIRRWATCPKPWLAGLPNFERLTLFNSDGTLSGHIRGWNHDPLVFSPALKMEALGAGITSFRPDQSLAIFDTKISPDQQLVHRMPDENILRSLIAVADEAGAKGIIFFALPGPGLQAAYSPSHLSSPPSTQSQLNVVYGADGNIVIHNPGPKDFPTLATGWSLEITSPRSGAFRAASPGAFAKISYPRGIPPEFSRSSTLHFSRLRAGDSLFSGKMLGKQSELSWQLKGSEKQEEISGSLR